MEFLFNDWRNYHAHPIIIQCCTKPMKIICAGLYLTEDGVSNKMPEVDILVLNFIAKIKILLSNPLIIKNSEIVVKIKSMFVLLLLDLISRKLSTTMDTIAAKVVFREGVELEVIQFYWMLMLLNELMHNFWDRMISIITEKDRYQFEGVRYRLY